MDQQRVLWNRDFRESGEVASEAKAGAESDSFQGNVCQVIYGAGESDFLFSDAPGINIELCNTLEKVEVEERSDSRHMTVAPIGAAGKEELETMTLPTEFKRLSIERKEKLDKLGFVWSLRTKRIEDHWDDMFRQVSGQRFEKRIFSCQKMFLTYL